MDIMDMDNIIVPQSTTKLPISQIKIKDDDYRDLNTKYWNGHESLKTINGESLFGEGDININNTLMIEVSYSNLKELRDDSLLIPGQQYRITDYTTTTIQENTISADHKFDIIVTALTEDTLSENASTCCHEEIYITEFYSLSGWDGSGGHFVYIGENIVNGKVYSEYHDSNYGGGKLLFDFDDASKVYYNSQDDIRFMPSYYLCEGYGYYEWTPYDGMSTIGGDEFYVPIISLFDESNIMMTEIAESIRKQYNINYFRYAGANLSAWKIWYSLDNDTNRFKWADSESGKGVIYRMIDEWGNDCPYDFKNIMFERGLNSEGGGIAEGGYEYFFAYCYTFSWEYTFDWENHENSIIDASIFGNNGTLLNDEGQIDGVYGNIIGVYNSYDGLDESPQSTKQYLNDIVFLSTYSYDGGIYCGCYSNTFGNGCYSNTFGNECSSNTFGNNCYANTFGDSCYSNTFSNDCYENELPGYCLYNTFDDSCFKNNVEGTMRKYNIKKGVSNKNIYVEFINSEIGIDVWVTSSGELIQEPINEYISFEDIDLMWDEIFCSEGYYSSTDVVEEEYENINSIGIGDYDEEKEGSDEE